MRIKNIGQSYSARCQTLELARVVRQQATAKSSAAVTESPMDRGLREILASLPCNRAKALPAQP